VVLNNFLFIDFDGYYTVRTDEGQLRPKYIFSKCGTNIYFLLNRGLVYHHHRILNLVLLYQNCKIFGSTKKVYL